jgi:hypothetical protein
MNKSVKTKDFNGDEITLIVKKPSNKDIQDAQMCYNSKVSELIKKSCDNKEPYLSRNQLNQYLNKLGAWTPEDNKLFTQLQLDIRELEKQLMLGGKKVSEAKNMVLEMHTKRNMMMALYNKRSQFDEITIESIAEQHRFRFFMTRCVTKEDGTLVYKNIDHYIENQDAQISIDTSRELATIIYGFQANFAESLPESKWMRKFRMVDEQGRLVNKEGKLIDSQGKLVNEDGRFVDKDGNFVDIDGNKIDENGELVIEGALPFIDDETGQPVV